jgi:F-type H+-transporting ATPase subunit delta
MESPVGHRALIHPRRKDCPDRAPKLLLGILRQRGTALALDDDLVVADQFAKAGIGGLTANFLLFVASNRRLFAVRDMTRDFRKLVARWRGEVSAEVTVAEKLSDAHLEALKSALKSVSGGQAIDLQVRVDPSIIGGLMVKLGSRMVDNSLRTKLNAIKHAMKEAG